jgi:hypothetical protein
LNWNTSSEAAPNGPSIRKIADPSGAKTRLGLNGKSLAIQQILLYDSEHLFWIQEIPEVGGPITGNSNVNRNEVFFRCACLSVTINSPTTSPADGKGVPLLFGNVWAIQEQVLP